MDPFPFLIPLLTLAKWQHIQVAWQLHNLSFFIYQSIRGPSERVMHRKDIMCQPFSFMGKHQCRAFRSIFLSDMQLLGQLTLLLDVSVTLDLCAYRVQTVSLCCMLSLSDSAKFILMHVTLCLS